MCVLQCAYGCARNTTTRRCAQRMPIQVLARARSPASACASAPIRATAPPASCICIGRALAANTPTAAAATNKRTQATSGQSASQSEAAGAQAIARARACEQRSSHSNRWRPHGERAGHYSARAHNCVRRPGFNLPVRNSSGSSSSTHREHKELN